MAGPNRKPLADRFWPKVSRRSDVECWEWTAAKCFGYGVIGSGGHDGRMLRAHRVAWELLVGRLDDDDCVLHRCDNRGCVNPKHLFVGDRADNNADCRSKGRAAASASTRHVGRANGRAILVEGDISEIRAQLAAGVSGAEIARALGVSKETIYAIKSGRNWHPTVLLPA